MQSKNYLGNVEHIKAGDHTKDIQAYLDYYAIVGDDDGGKMMTDAEFEAYKKSSWSKSKSFICLLYKC